MVGSLVGDAWMRLPWLSRQPVDVIAGTYAHPVWQWGLRHIQGCQYRIREVWEDPDDGIHPFCPGFGYPALDAGYAAVVERFGSDQVVPLSDLGTSYYREPGSIPLAAAFPQGEHVAVHAETRHNWKNEAAIHRLRFQRPVKAVGFAHEFHNTWIGCEYVEGFDRQVETVLTAYCTVAVLSSFAALASIFQRRQVVLSFTEDAALALNPNLRVLVRPTYQEAQALIHELGL